MNFGSKVAVLLLSMAAAVFVAEWSIRLALPAYDPAGHVVWQHHPQAGTVLGQPGTAARQIKNSGDYNVSVRFNRHGFRDRQDVASGNSRDIYVVGDSFAFGWGVEEHERFSNVLARLRNERVFNLAASLNVDGYEKLFAYAEVLGAKFGRRIVPEHDRRRSKLCCSEHPDGFSAETATGSGWHRLVVDVHQEISSAGICPLFSHDAER